MNIAINGFGRIGRAALKLLLESRSTKVVAINDPNPVENLVHLLKYDSVYGSFGVGASFNKTSITVGKAKIKVFSERDPSKLPWGALGVDVVIEATGVFRTHSLAMQHVFAGAKKVIISAPSKECGCGEKKCDVKMVVMGVNENAIRKSDKVVSMASCTTNCLLPVTSVLERSFGVKKAIMTTVHAYTAGQNLVDGASADLRRGRAGAVNIVPTTTGAARAACSILPKLSGKFDGVSIRVPVPTVSLVDAVYVLKKRVSVERVNGVFVKASKSVRLKGVLKVSNEPLVSSDYIGEAASAVVDLGMTNVVDGDLVKVLAWYDNEWGYCARLADLCEFMKKKKLI